MPLMKQKEKALLVLEDGSVFEGNAFACGGETMGEVVFNTAMTGYQEVITATRNFLAVFLEGRFYRQGVSSPSQQLAHEAKPEGLPGVLRKNRC